MCDDNLFVFPGTIWIYLLYLLVVFADHFYMKSMAGGEQDESETSVKNANEAPLNEGDPNHNLLPQFWSSINPIDKEEWNEGSWFTKMCAILKVRFFFSPCTNIYKLSSFFSNICRLRLFLF